MEDHCGEVEGLARWKAKQATEAGWLPPSEVARLREAILDVASYTQQPWTMPEKLKAIAEDGAEGVEVTETSPPFDPHCDQATL